MGFDKSKWSEKVKKKLMDKRVVSCDRCRKRFQKEFQKDEDSNVKEKATIFEKIAKFLSKNPFFELNDEELGFSVHWKGALKCGDCNQNRVKTITDVSTQVSHEIHLKIVNENLKISHDELKTINEKIEGKIDDLAKMLNELKT